MAASSRLVDHADALRLEAPRGSGRGAAHSDAATARAEEVDDEGSEDDHGDEDEKRVEHGLGVPDVACVQTRSRWGATISSTSPQSCAVVASMAAPVSASHAVR